MSVGVDGGTHRFVVGIGPTGNVDAQSISGSSGVSSSSGAVSAGTWAHIGGIFAATNSRQAVLNGAIATANTTSITPAGINRTLIGARILTTPGAFADADIAECAAWNATLVQDEWAALAKGISPLLIRPDALLAYWPLIGRSSPEPDWVGGFDMTLTNSPTTAAHPRIIMPRKAYP
jgi:hypothetical protein